MFDNLGIGIALLIVWAALYHYLPMIWVNALTSPVLLLGTYGTSLGLVNALFLALIKSGSKAPSSDSESDKPAVLAIKIAFGVCTAVGFLASLIQILEFFKVIP